MFGLLIPVIVVVSSAVLMIRLRFFLFLSFRRIVEYFCAALGRKQARCAFLLALSGTLGVGNIVGVAVGLIVGGAGSVFWLFISSFFSMVLKYAEASLSAQNVGKTGYGMISLIAKSYVRCGAFLSKTYGILCILLSFFMGAVLQSSGACSSVAEITGINGIIIGALLCFCLVAAVAFKKIGIIKIVSWLLPIASVLYLTLCLFCILKGAHNLPTAVLNIFNSAFDFNSFKGGVLGFLISSGIKEGFSRGLLSNEAGAGTSTLAHGTNSVSSAAEAGVLGMGEIIVDTVVFCPLTALSVLVSISNVSVYCSGIDLILDSLGKTFVGAKIPLSICIFIFAYATVICWFYYGMLAVDYVFGRGRRMFSVLYIVSVLFGAVIGDILAVELTDAVLLLLTLITTATLIKCSDSLVELSERGGLLKPRSKCQAKPSLHPRI